MSGQERENVGGVVTAGRNSATILEPSVKNEPVEGPITWEEMRAMLRREPLVYEKTWRPTTGGILAVIAGVWNILAGVGIVLGSNIYTSALSGFPFAITFSVAAGWVMVGLGCLAVIGGIMALIRRLWAVALIGSIVSLFPSPFIIPYITGTFALIFVSLGRREFGSYPMRHSAL